MTAPAAIVTSPNQLLQTPEPSTQDSTWVRIEPALAQSLPLPEDYGQDLQTGL